jgi:hypothetical protein
LRGHGSFVSLGGAFWLSIAVVIVDPLVLRFTLKSNSITKREALLIPAAFLAFVSFLVANAWLE